MVLLHLSELSGCCRLTRGEIDLGLLRLCLSLLRSLLRLRMSSLGCLRLVKGLLGGLGLLAVLPAVRLVTPKLTDSRVEFSLLVRNGRGGALARGEGGGGVASRGASRWWRAAGRGWLLEMHMARRRGRGRWRRGRRWRRCHDRDGKRRRLRRRSGRRGRRGRGGRRRAPAVESPEAAAQQAEWPAWLARAEVRAEVRERGDGRCDVRGSGHRLHTWVAATAPQFAGARPLERRPAGCRLAQDAALEAALPAG